MSKMAWMVRIEMLKRGVRGSLKLVERMGRYY